MHVGPSRSAAPRLTMSAAVAGLLAARTLRRAMMHALDLPQAVDARLHR
jgi:hypothetical protein